MEGEIARRFFERDGVPASQALGIIEVGLPCINLDFAAEKSDSVGRVLPAYELRMEDAGLWPGLGEVPQARVVIKPGMDQDALEDDLREWCAGWLASYKVPERIERVEALPRTASGKILHRETTGGRR